jgi:drug/metabolite transporter (DMT)-like permease
MGIILVLISALMWSFVPVLVKISAVMVDSYTISFFRFFFGILFLFVLVKILQGRIRIGWKEKWIWYGGLGKAVNYIFENLGVVIGFAYEQILIMPMIMLYMMIASFLIFKERLNAYTGIAAVLSLGGIFLVSWNGVPLSELSLVVTGIFAISALGACFHFVSQKILIQKMSSEDMNLSVFFWATLMTSLPLPIAFEAGEAGFNGWAMLCLVALGFITGVSFFIYGLGTKKLSFMTSSILINASVLFTLLWSFLFFREPITLYTISGALLFIMGLVLVNVPQFIASTRNHKAKLSTTDG